jgi:hypothetical protein
MCFKISVVFLILIASILCPSRETISFFVLVSSSGLNNKYLISAYFKRFNFLHNSSDLPANIGPQINSIQPLGFL